MARPVMRTREEILKDGSRPEYLNLEVLLDIRDQFIKLQTELVAIKKGLGVTPIKKNPKLNKEKI